jgi:ABC-type amino acid transport system permease subunit
MSDTIIRWLENNPGKGYTLLVVAFVMFLVSTWVVQSHMEAKSFSRITGEQITTWDAMWVQLRVDRPIIHQAH